MSIGATGAEILGGDGIHPPPWYTSLKHPMALGVKRSKDMYFSRFAYLLFFEMYKLRCIFGIIFSIQSNSCIKNFAIISIKKFKKNKNFIRVELLVFDLLKAFEHFFNQILLGVGFHETKRFFISFSKVFLFFCFLWRFDWIEFYASRLCEKIYHLKKLDILADIDKELPYTPFDAYSPTFIPPILPKNKRLVTWSLFIGLKFRKKIQKKCYELWQRNTY